MTQFFSWNKDPWEGFWSNQWSCVGGNDRPFTEYKAAAEEKTPPGQPLLPDGREGAVRRKPRKRKGSPSPHETGRKTGSKKGGVQTGERERGGGGRRRGGGRPPLGAPCGGLEMAGAGLPERLLLVGSELEVLGGQFEAQGVGSQGVDHVLVAFSTVLHQERTPVRLRGADQLQTLPEERRHLVGLYRPSRCIRSYLWCRMESRSVLSYSSVHFCLPQYRYFYITARSHLN